MNITPDSQPNASLDQRNVDAACGPHDVVNQHAAEMIVSRWMMVV
jgi:hypothetical protein